MRIKLFTNLALISIVVLSRLCAAVENPAVSNPAVSNPMATGRVPMSSIRSGLVNVPNPIDTSSNLIVTGQVSGGKHFRGVLPYNVNTNFGGRLGSTSLDSFLRYSAGTGGIGSSPGKYEPYYSPTGTVTTTSPSYPRVIGPPALVGESRSYAIDGRVDSAQLETETQELRSPDVYDAEIVGLRPMSRTREQIERTISNEMKNYRQAKEEADQYYESQMQSFKQKLEQITERTSDLQQTAVNQKQLLQSAPPTQGPEDKTQQQEGSQMPKPTEPADQDKQTDIYQRMRQQLEQLQEQDDQARAAAQTEQDNKKEESEKQDKDAASITFSELLGTEKEKPDSDTSEIEELSRQKISITAGTILDKYDSFASYSQDKFNRYMRAAERYLKEGKYYRAADCYTLATIYKSDDPLAYAGKCHALFAAGEYMSSALFLSRALEIFPEYAWFEVDLVSMFDNKDILENRIVDIEHWVEENGAGELQFLLAYVYFQMGRVSYAWDNIQSARMKMLGSEAVVALEKAIKDAVETGSRSN